jgi:hypothetical protein
MPKSAEKQVKRQGGAARYRTLKKDGKTMTCAVTRKEGPKGGRTVCWPKVSEGRDDIDKLPLPPEAKSYARGKGMAFLKAKPQNYIDMIAAVTGQKDRKSGFKNKDAGERSEGGKLSEAASIVEVLLYA